MIYPGQAPPQPQVLAAGPSYPQSNPQARQPIVRGRSIDEAPRNALPTMPSPRELGVAMPTPEQLGVPMPKPEQLAVQMPSPKDLGVPVGQVQDTPGVDWAATRTRLDKLGATSFALSRVEEGFQFVVLLSSGKPDQAYRIEARASTEVEAVQVALRQASETCR